jgi:hypothetical protein
VNVLHLGCFARMGVGMGLDWVVQVQIRRGDIRLAEREGYIWGCSVKQMVTIMRQCVGH